MLLCVLWTWRFFILMLMGRECRCVRSNVPEEMLWECGWLQPDHRPSPTCQLACSLLGAALRQECATLEAAPAARWGLYGIWPRWLGQESRWSVARGHSCWFERAVSRPRHLLSLSVRAPSLMDWTWGRLRLFHRVAGQVLQSRAGGPCGLREAYV